MKIKREVMQFDVFDLFLHDKDRPAMDRESLATLMNDLYHEGRLERYENIRYSETLDRFFIEPIEEKADSYVKRCYSKKDLQKMWPKYIFNRINKLNNMEITC